MRQITYFADLLNHVVVQKEILEIGELLYALERLNVAACQI